jgi:uncharacterized FlaG/YvyC family protein
MDTGLTIRPTGSVAQASYVRPEAAPVREAVATDLAPSRAVTAAEAQAPALRQDSVRTSLAQHATTREIVLDPQSREVIYRVMDVRSGRVVHQVPEQALLRMRAYVRALSNGLSPNEAQAQTDLPV